MIDPLLINKPLLYKTADDKYCIALILHAERDPATGRFAVSQATPSELFNEAWANKAMSSHFILSDDCNRSAASS